MTSDRTIRNDRLTGVLQNPVNEADMRSLRELGAARLDEIERFFQTYNRAQGRRFTLTGRWRLRKALALVSAATERQ